MGLFERHYSFFVISLIFFIALIFIVSDFPLSIAFLSIYIAVVSFGVGLGSQYLAKESDERVNEIANTLLLSIISTFEDRRLSIQKAPIDNQIHLWKAKVDLDKIKKIGTGKCIIDDDNFDILMRRFNRLMDVIIKIKTYLLVESLMNIMQIYELVFEIVPERKDLKEEANKKFIELLNLDESVVVDSNLFRKIREKFKLKDKKKKEKIRWERLSKHMNKIYKI